MQIEVPLTLTLEVPTAEAAAAYLEVAADGTLTSTVNVEFLADLFDDGLPDMMIYGEDKVLKLCGRTPESVKKALAAKLP